MFRRNDPNLNRVNDFVLLLLLHELLKLQGFFGLFGQRNLLGLSNNKNGNDTLKYF